MADLATGISKVAVQIMADRVRNAIKEEEAEKWQIVQRDLVFVAGEVEMMQSFLDTADGERMKNNVVMRTWVRQVSDLSCDVEDFTEFVLRLLALPFESGKALPLDEAVAEVAQLKARALDVSQRSVRYCLIGDSRSKTLAQGFRHDGVASFMTEQRSHPIHDYGLLGRDMEVDKLFPLTREQGLEAPEAFQLFKKIFEENGYSLEEAMISSEAEIILSKCGGLPSVIVAVAEYLATQPRDTLNQELRHLSANFVHELETKTEFDSLQGLLAWIPFYLHTCPRYLKACMLYVSIFPPDKIIRRRRLVRRWIAEGYLQGTNSISLEKYAEKVLDELVTLGILQPALKASKVTGIYRVNGFFREYIISRPKEERILFPMEVSALEKGHEMMYRLTTEGIGQHLAVGSTWEKDQSVFESFDFSRLRSLTMFRRLRPFYVDSDRMRVLRVLDLENATADLGDTNLEEMGKLPPRLKFLSLRGHQGISRLPDSFGDLVLLETLDIRDTEIVTLPPCITNLRKLQYIRAGASVRWSHDDGCTGDEEQSAPRSRLHTTIPFLRKFRRGRRRPVGYLQSDPEMPRDTKHLTALQTLGAVNISRVPKTDIVDAFFYLKQLKKLDVSGINQENKGCLYPAFLNNSHLESLSLHLETRHDVLCWGDIPSRHCLQSLNLYGRVEEPPSDDIMTLSNLKKLTLDMTTLFTREVLQSIGSLPSLQTLRLTVKKGRDQDGELLFSAGLFSNLQVLQITCHSRLHVIFDSEAMQMLKLLKLKIRYSYEPSLNFSGLQRLVCLDQVVLIHAHFVFHDDTLTQTLQQQLDRHPKRPALKLECEQREENQRRLLARYQSPHQERHWMTV